MPEPNQTPAERIVELRRRRLDIDSKTYVPGSAEYLEALHECERIDAEIRALEEMERGKP